MTPRIQNLAAALRNHGVKAFFAQSPLTMSYLANFGEDAHERFLTLAVRDDGKVALICPALTANQATRVGITDIRGWKDGEDAALLLADLGQEWGLTGQKMAVDDGMKATSLLVLQSTFPAASFVAGGEILASLMRKKEEAELQALTDAAKIADEAFKTVFPALRAGLTELQVQKLLFKAMEEGGGQPTFGIVAAGAMGAEPHHGSDNTILQTGDVVILDFGCQVNGYQSDITRTVAIGVASDQAKDVYRLVYDSHMAGRRSAKPGVTAGQVDQAARLVIEKGGYGAQFYHRLGHGIGLNGHEAPYIMPGSPVLLAVGDCFSIEPGIYLPGEFGVRIENIVTVTPDGCHSFNDEPSAVLLETK